MKTPTFTAFRRAGLAASALLLAACSTTDHVSADATATELQERFGNPTVTCPLPDGGERRVWSRQPDGQFAWASIKDAEGKEGPLQQMLSDAGFAQLQGGYWPAEKIRCEFGPPAEIKEIGRGNTRQIVWSYRFRHANAWDSLMNLYMGPEGDVLRRSSFIQDPRGVNSGEGNATGSSD